MDTEKEMGDNTKVTSKGEEKNAESAPEMLNIIQLEYQNEFSRASTLDTKVGITLPIVATYFFLVLQLEEIDLIFTHIPENNTASEIIQVMAGPLLYISVLFFAGISFLSFFEAIMTHKYQSINVEMIYCKENLLMPKEKFSATICALYVKALSNNRMINDVRVKKYCKGWTYAVVSMALFSILCLMFF